MPPTPTQHDRDVTTLSLEQREWIRRQGRLARALEAAQRRSGKRFLRNVPKPQRAAATTTRAGGSDDRAAGSGG
jgi:hypothetical protein